MHDTTAAPARDNQELHDLFRVGKNADEHELARAYLRLRQRYDPQANPDDPLAPDIVRYLDTAYGRLVASRREAANQQTNDAARPSPGPPSRSPKRWSNRWQVFASAVTFATIALLAVLFFSPVARVSSAPAGDAAAGRTLWATLGGSPYCGSCHGVNGEGAFGPDLAGRKVTFEQFRQQLRRPYGIMPAYTEQQVSDQQVADLVAFFGSLPEATQLGPWRVRVPDGAPLGQRLFIETVGCGQCHGATADRQRQGETRQGVTSLAQFAELVYNHTGTFPTGRMGNYSRSRLPEQTLEAMWQWESHDLGLRVPVVPTITTAASGGSVTYDLTLENQAKAYAAGNLYIALSVPIGATVMSTSSYGFQRVERYAAGGYDIAVWLTPQLAASEKRTYSMTVSGTGAAGGSGAFVRWLSPTRAGDQVIVAATAPR